MGFRRVIVLSLAIGWVGWLPSGARADDWSLSRPSGGDRMHRARSKRRPVASRPSPRPAESRERSEVLARRYLAVLRRDPLDTFALERLLTLRRAGDGSLDGLLEQLAAELAERPDDGVLRVLLGQVQRQAGNAVAARASLAAAAEHAPLPAHLALGRMERAVGELAAARASFEAALPLVTRADARRELQRELGEVCLDLADFDAAAQHYAALTGKGAGVYAVTELARALAERGHHARAAKAYQEALGRLGGDGRVAAQVLLPLARAQLEAGAHDSALATLERARRVTAQSPGLRHELQELLLEAYRRAGRLPELAEALSHRAGRRPTDHELLGRIYDELGDHPRALDAFRRALALSPRQADTRLEVIAILSREGRLDEVVAEYRALVRTVPREPRFALDLVRTLMETGHRQEALRELASALQRLPRDPRMLRGAHELYARWDQPEQARRVLARLAAVEPHEPAHLMALGEHLLEQGDADAAVATWRRILHVVPDRAAAHAQLGETLLDHDMALPALAEYERAVKLRPDDVQLLRGRAEALERAHRSADAVEAWLDVHARAQGDPSLRREARRRAVRLWASRGELRGHAVERERAFGYAPERGVVPAPKGDPDLEAGRFLAEIYEAMARGRRRGRQDPRRLEAAEAVLERVIALAPGDVESMLSLERLRALRGDAEGATRVLKRLVEADPKNARSYLARMASNALSLYRDDEAIAYAKRSVALDPRDASAHTRLGDLYRARQDADQAIASYTRALELDPGLHPVYFRLAELHLSRGEPLEADRLLRQVVRSAPDDDLVQRAARAAIQLGIGTGRLDDLEGELLPLALGHPQRPLYRRLLVELYDAITRPLVQVPRLEGRAPVGTRVLEGESGAGHPADPSMPRAVGEPAPTIGPSAAREQLASIGRRAIKPLLEALSDPDPTQRRVAVDVLGEVDNPHAALPLLAMAEAGGDMELRRRALRASARVAPDALAPRLAALARGDERRLRDVAAEGLAAMDGPQARRALAELAVAAAPPVRGHALLGLARAGDAAAAPLARAALREGRDPWVRGAAALALGMVGDADSQRVLVQALRQERGAVAAAVAVALGLAGDRGAAAGLAQAAFADDPEVGRAALLALHHLGRADVAPPPPRPSGGRPSLDALVNAWGEQLEWGAGEGGLERFDTELGEAIGGALAGSSAAATAALRLLEGARPELAPGATPEVLRSRGLALAGAVVPNLSLLVGHREASVRAAAVRLLGRLGGDAGGAALATALGDRDGSVRSATLEALALGGPAPALADAVARMVRRERSWWIRLRAVRALAAVGGAAAGPELIRVLERDGYAYVREAAAEGLGRLGGVAAVRALERAHRGDSEARVRDAAARALGAAAP